MNIKKKLISKYTKSQIKEKRILKLNDFGSKIKCCIGMVRNNNKLSDILFINISKEKKWYRKKRKNQLKMIKKYL